MPQSQGLSSSTTTITSVKHNKKYNKEKSLKTHNKQMKSDTSVRLEDIPSRSRYGDTDVAADAPRPRSSLTPADYVDYQIKQNIERYKKQIIVHLMDQGLECLDNQLKMYEGLCTEDLTGTCGPSPQSPFNISNVGNRAIAKLAGQKRQLQKDDTDEEKDTEAADGAKRSKISKRTKTEMNLKPFACPYFKFDPERFGKHRTCCGPGFTDLNRLKEHLKRQHRCFECSRCFELFYKEEKLERHQRQSKPCAVKERINAIRDYGDGYDQTQEKELKKRLKANDKDKWAAWYRVLFCVDATSLEVPSPYFENPESRAPSSKSRACGKHRAFFDYVRRELPHLMLDLITEEVDRLMAGIEGKARQSIQPKLPDLTFKLQRLFQNIPPLSVQGEEADAGDDSEPGSSAPEHFNLDLFQDFELIPPDCFDLPGSGYLNTEPSDYSSMLSATDTSSVPLLSSTSDSSFDTTDAGAFGGSRLHDPPRPYYSS